MLCRVSLDSQPETRWFQEKSHTVRPLLSLLPKLPIKPKWPTKQQQHAVSFHHKPDCPQTKLKLRENRNSNSIPSPAPSEDRNSSPAPIT